MQVVNQFSLPSFKSTSKTNSRQDNPIANSSQIKHLSTNNSTNQFVSFKSKPLINIEDEAEKIIKASSILETPASKSFDEIMQKLKKRIPEENKILAILLKTREKASGLSNLTDKFFISGQSVDEIAKLKLKTRIDNIDKLFEISDQEFARIFKADEIAAADLTKEQVGQGMSKIARSCKEITFDDRLRPHYPDLKIKDIQVALNKVVTEKKIDPEIAVNIYKESIVPVLTKQFTENLDKVRAKKACKIYNNFCQIFQKQVKPTSKS